VAGLSATEMLSQGFATSVVNRVEDRNEPSWYYL